jgi:hypothetical protein
MVGLCVTFLENPGFSNGWGELCTRHAGWRVTNEVP